MCSSCEFFKKSVTFAGKESSEKRIDLPEDDPEMIRRLITYFYVGDYDPSNGWDPSKFKDIDQHGSTTATKPTYHLRSKAFGTSSTDPCACLAPNLKQIPQPCGEIGANSSPGDTCSKSAHDVQVASPLTIHATMYALGDKYHVQGLCELAKEKFESCLQHHAHSEDFVSAIQIVYSSTPDSNRNLRDSVLSAFKIHFGTDISQIPGAEARLDSIDELSFHLIKSWPTKILKPKSAEDSTLREPVVPSSLFGQPTTTSATSLFTTSGAASASQPSSTQPAAAISSSGGFGGFARFGSPAQSQPPANAQPTTTRTRNTTGSLFVTPQPTSTRATSPLRPVNTSTASQSSSTQQATSGGLFGSSRVSAASQPRTGLFGNAPTQI